jgi:hypothetical protein
MYPLDVLIYAGCRKGLEVNAQDVSAACAKYVTLHHMGALSILLRVSGKPKFRLLVCIDSFGAASWWETWVE